METLRESLIRLLLASPAESAEAARGLEASQWRALLPLAAAWGVLPRANQRLEAAREKIPVDVRRELRAHVSNGFVRSSLAARQGTRALEQLRRRGIQAVTFKGLAALASLHGDPAGRAIGDVDILLSPASMKDALAALAEVGLAPEPPGELRDYMDFVRHSPGFAGNFAVALAGESKFEIDLHWSLGFPEDSELAPQRVIERGRVAQVFGQAVPVVSPADGLLLSVHHAVRENFAPDTVMRNLLDAEGWCGLLAARGELPAAMELAGACGLGAPLRAAAGILTRFDPGSGARGLLEGAASPVEQRAAARLAELFLWQARAGRLPDDLFSLFDPRAWRQIAAGLLSGWRRHRRFMRALETKAQGGPVPLSRRLAALLGSLGRLPPSHLRLLRTVARVKRDFQRSVPRRR